MNANTVYDVFLALPHDEKEKFIVLVKEQEVKAYGHLKRPKTKKVKFTKQDAIKYLLATVFKPKY